MAAAAGFHFAPLVQNPFQQEAPPHQKEPGKALKYGSAAAAAVPQTHRKFKDVDLSEAGRQAREEALAAVRAEKIGIALSKAVVKSDIASTVVGSATAAPAKDAPVSEAYRAAALASAAALSVHELVDASPNLKTAADINALILGMADLDFSGNADG